ncbi:hypothetical protein P879_10696 [Paragonimus westermani]|uniref:Uncharacterized protein n=1 Tax=Paragonimus westermani TaxID=34504 RepID=A0A8T0DAK7_9TREM|nr:hypothetical protein P879_10696 [Paragonimus westermani]
MTVEHCYEPQTCCGLRRCDRGRGGRGRGRDQFGGAGHEQQFGSRGGQRGASSGSPRPPFTEFQPQQPVPGPEIGLPTTTTESLPSQQPRGWGPSGWSSPPTQVIAQVETVVRQARRRRGKGGAKPSAEPVVSSDRASECPSPDSVNVISASEKPELEHPGPVGPQMGGAALVVQKSGL